MFCRRDGVGFVGHRWRHRSGSGFILGFRITFQKRYFDQQLHDGIYGYTGIVWFYHERTVGLIGGRAACRGSDSGCKYWGAYSSTVAHSIVEDRFFVLIGVDCDTNGI